jgi:hypothetical protein
MARERGNVGIGEKDGHIVTSFVPPLYKSKLFEATASADQAELVEFATH